MPVQHIIIRQSFNAPAETIFTLLTDHETFGRLVNAKIKRVKDSLGSNKNGLGSVRRIKAFLAPAFEETVVTFIPDQLMEYRVSKGSPIKNHKGCMAFFDEQGKTRIEYTIDFEPKLPFPFWGIILRKAIEKPIRNGLKRLAGRYDTK